MKRITILFLGTIFFFGPIATYAQKDSVQLSREMTLEKDFDPVFRDASKINSLPIVKEPKIERSAIEYSDFTIRVTPKLQIPILGAAAPADTQVKHENGFVRLGIGNYLNTVGQLEWSIVSTPRDLLHFGVEHQSSSGNIKLHQNNEKTKMKLNNERIVLGYKHLFDALELSTQLGYINKGFNYYGYRFYEAPLQNGLKTGDWKQMQQGFDARLGIKSSVKKVGFNYLFNVGYSYYGNKYNRLKQNGLEENQIATNFNLFSFFENGNSFGLKGHMSNYFYAKDKEMNLYYSLKDVNDYTLLNLTPYFNIDRDNYFLHLGVLASYSFNKENKLFIAPDVEAQVKFIDELLLYAKVKGNVNENSIQNIARENCFVSPDMRIQDSRTLFSSEVGFKIAPVSGLFIQPFIGYKMVENEHFYVNNLFRSVTGSEFYPIYTDLKQFWVGGTIRYQYKKYLDLALSAVKNVYKTSSSVVHTNRSIDIRNAETKAWHKPETELDLKLSSQVVPSLKLSVGYYLGAGRKAMTLRSNVADVATLDDISELNFGATYTIVKKFSVWGQLNNILNKKYELFQGYPAQGINFMIGAGYVF